MYESDLPYPPVISMSPLDNRDDAGENRL